MSWAVGENPEEIQSLRQQQQDDSDSILGDLMSAMLWNNKIKKAEKFMESKSAESIKFFAKLNKTKIFGQTRV